MPEGTPVRIKEVDKRTWVNSYKYTVEFKSKLFHYFVKTRDDQTVIKRVSNYSSHHSSLLNIARAITYPTSIFTIM